MIPIRDDAPRNSFPFVNFALIGANAWIFFQEILLGPKLEAFLGRYGLVPLRYAKLDFVHAAALKPALIPFFSAMFLHGGWLHLISNMWVLYIFGDNVEDRLGHLRYAVFYLLCGLSAGAVQLWASWGANIPTIGASGAIAGVMGAYFVLYPRARVLTLVPIFIFIRFIEIPASIFLALWLWSQIYAARMALSAAGHLGGIAWWAHIGGFAGGVILLGLFLPPQGLRSRRKTA